MGRSASDSPAAAPWPAVPGTLAACDRRRRRPRRPDRDAAGGAAARQPRGQRRDRDPGGVPGRAGHRGRAGRRRARALPALSGRRSHRGRGRGPARPAPAAARCRPALLHPATRPRTRLRRRLRAPHRSGRRPLDILLTSRVAVDRSQNRAELWLRLGAEIGAHPEAAAPAFRSPEAERRTAEALLLGGGFEDGRLLIGLAPGAGYGRGADGYSAADLRWDVERHAHLANQLAHRHGAGIVLLGGQEDRALTDELLLDLEADHLDLVGQLSVSEAAAVVARCDLVVAADTPVLHMAAATGTPSIGVFGPTDGRRRGPWGPEQHVVQAVSGRSPVAGTHRLRVDDVLARIESSL